MSILSRVKKLELTQMPRDQIVIIRTIVDANSEHFTAQGYRFKHNDDFVDVLRQANESEEALKQRAIDEHRRVSPVRFAIVLHPI